MLGVVVLLRSWFSRLGGVHLVPDIVGGMFAIVVNVCAQLSIPLLIAAIVDDALLGRDLGALGFLSAGLAGVALLLQAGRIGQEILFRRAAQRALDNLQLDLSQHLVGLPLGFFDRSQTGRLHSLFVEDCPQLTRMIDPFLRQVFYNVILLLGVLALLTAKYGRMVLLALLLVPVYLILPTLLSRRTREANRDHLEARAHANARFQELLDATRDVKVFGRESWIVSRARQSLDRRFRSYRRFNWLTSFHSIGAILYFFIAALVYRFGGERVIQGSLTIGGLVALIALLSMLESPVGQLAKLNDVLQGCRAAMERLQPILAEPREETGGKDLVIGSEGAGVRFESVTFRYPGASQPALDAVSFTVEPGRRVAIVGPSGAGKSTLVHLLLGLYRPDAGRILVGDRDLRELSLASLRAEVGLVRQDAVLLSGSVRDNIGFGHPWATDEEIEEAARIAGVDEFVARLPKGFDTEIGERGVALSGGQRQRIAIARTILRQPALLVLDEATSSLDGPTERRVREALERAARGRTVLAIAHRLATVRHADAILVLDQGRLVAQGGHSDLLRTSEAYRHLHQVGSMGDVVELQRIRA